jgi:hypothetical protein
VITQTDLELADGRALHAYDTGADRARDLAVVWLHGAPSIGAPPEPDRVVAVVSAAGLAPFGADGLDWFAGLGPIAAFRAAAGGRAVMEDYLSSAGFDPDDFTPADQAALAGTWSWLGGGA